MKTNEAAPIAPELDAMGPELAALDGDCLDDHGPAPDGAGGAVAVRDRVREARDVFGLGVVMLSPMLPYLPEVYTPERLDALAGAYVPVADKYGWDVGGLLSEYSAEVALVAVALPLAVQTRMAHIEWSRSREPAAQVEPGEPAAAVAPEGANPAGGGGVLMPAGVRGVH